MAVSSNSPVSIASNSSTAAAGGSVIDGNISKQTQKTTTQISALGTLKSALSTFQSSLSAIDTVSAFNAAKAASSDATVFTATADSNAQPGSYAVTVSQLASAQQLVSKPFVGGGSATVGTGTLQVSLGGSSFNITIDNAHN